MSRPHAERLALLTSPGFLLSLALLGVNDHYLKAAFPGFVTGKLSDVAGLFAAAVFLCAFLPRRAGAVHVALAALFTLWKLPLSDPLVAWWNSLDLLRVARVTDLTDLAALLVLLASWRFVGRATPIPRLAAARPFIAAASVFLFAATSVPDEPRQDGTMFVVRMPRDSVMNAVRAIAYRDSMYSIRVRHRAPSADTLWLERRVPTYDDQGNLYFPPVEYAVEIRPSATGETVLTLVEVTAAKHEWDNLSMSDLHADLLRILVEPLRDGRAFTPPAGRPPS